MPLQVIDIHQTPAHRVVFSRPSADVAVRRDRLQSILDQIELLARTHHLVGSHKPRDTPRQRITIVVPHALVAHESEKRRVGVAELVASSPTRKHSLRDREDEEEAEEAAAVE